MLRSPVGGVKRFQLRREGEGVGIAKTRRGRWEKEENNNKDGALTLLLNFKGYCKL